jgi:hypothetical protein
MVYGRKPDSGEESMGKVNAVLPNDALVGNNVPNNFQQRCLPDLPKVG